MQRVTCLGWDALQTIEINGKPPGKHSDHASAEYCYLQHWLSALLLGAKRLTALSVVADSVPWSPVLRSLSIRQLELSMPWVKPWLNVITADLSMCSSLEALKIADIGIRDHKQSMELPDLLLHDISTLQSVEFLGWYPQEKFTLPPGCLLRMVLFLEDTQWEELQRKACCASMLYLSCLDAQACQWPAGIHSMSNLQFLALHCARMEHEDLAMLQHIPHVYLDVKWYSSFTLSSGSWQSLQIYGTFGFKVEFSDADFFVRESGQFYFECSKLYSQCTEETFGVLHAACSRQGLACYHCVHAKAAEYAGDMEIASLSNVKLCKTLENETSGIHHHEKLLHLHGYWPDRGAYPELYRQDQQHSCWPAYASSDAVVRAKSVQTERTRPMEVFRGRLGDPYAQNIVCVDASCTIGIKL